MSLGNPTGCGSLPQDGSWGVRLEEQPAFLLPSLRCPVGHGRPPQRSRWPTPNANLIFSPWKTKEPSHRHLGRRRQPFPLGCVPLAPIPSPPEPRRCVRSDRGSSVVARRRGHTLPEPTHRDRVGGDARRAVGSLLAGVGRCRAAALRRAARYRDDPARRGHRHAVHSWSRAGPHVLGVFTASGMANMATGRIPFAPEDFTLILR